MSAGSGTLGDADPHEITDLLRAWSGGVDAALEALLPRVYDDLRRMARAQLARHRSTQTFQPTELVNELYLRLVHENKIDWKDRAHFFGVCALLMRFILVDQARRKHAHKRGGTATRMTVEIPGGDDAEQEAVDLLALDRALAKLEKRSPRQCRVIEMRFFAGLSVEETAESLRIASRTVKLDWTMARAWLFRELAGSPAT